MTELRGLPGLRPRRERARLTQLALSEQLQISRASIIAWENGDTYPSAPMLPKLAKALDCSIDDLFEFNSTNSEEECPCQPRA